MKKTFCLAIALLVLTLSPGFAQPTPGTTPSAAPGMSFSERLQRITQNSDASAEAPKLTKFDLNFPGGSPADLVAAIEKVTGKAVNVIIDKEDEKAQLPPLKVSGVDVPNLFRTLSENSKQYVNNELIKNYGFSTLDSRPGDNSLWKFYFYAKSGPVLFNLDFPGGTPAEFVKAIDQAMGKQLNVIINKEDEKVELPALEMHEVYLWQLFQTLEQASRKTVAVTTGPTSYSQYNTGYGFKSSTPERTDNSVWYFYVDKPSLPPVVSTQKAAQFYPLATYLDRGFTVDDITTAIQTGWKLAGETSPPELNYHKETKLLIAYGEPEKLKTISSVLNTLPYSNATHDQLDSLWQSVHDLQKALADLKGKSSSASAGTMEEKSGK